MQTHNPDEKPGGIEEIPPFPDAEIKAANPRQVPNRSPLRYPGGKTWLIPHLRHWLKDDPDTKASSYLYEPFAGGATASLTAVLENLVAGAVMVDNDPNIAAFWRVALSNPDYLIYHTTAFEPTDENIELQRKIAARNTPEAFYEEQLAFAMLVANRFNFNGNTSKGAGASKYNHRWYPHTINRRLARLRGAQSRLNFLQGDGNSLLHTYANMASYAQYAIFLDPPYNDAEGKGPGERLYTNHANSWHRLFQRLEQTQHDGYCPFLLTAPDTNSIRHLITAHDFHARTVTMKTGHHKTKRELLITPRIVHF